jgi:hypothetical protein
MNINISDKDQISLDDLKERALKRVYTVADLNAIKAGNLPTPGDYKEFREELDCGIRIVFTYELHQDGFFYRHAAMSVYAKDKYQKTFHEPYVFGHFRENILHQTVYRLEIDPAGIFPMTCWGDKGGIPAIHFLQREGRHT